MNCLACRRSIASGQQHGSCAQYLALASTPLREAGRGHAGRDYSGLEIWPIAAIVWALFLGTALLVRACQ